MSRFLVVLFLLSCGCTESEVPAEARAAKPAPEPTPKPGGGGKKVVLKFSFRSQLQSDQFVTSKAVRLLASQPRDFTVDAIWAIPYQKDVSSEAKIEVFPVGIAKIVRKGESLTLIGTRPGTGKLKATWTTSRGKELTTEIDLVVR